MFLEISFVESVIYYTNRNRLFQVTILSCLTVEHGLEIIEIKKYMKHLGSRSMGFNKSTENYLIEISRN